MANTTTWPREAVLIQCKNYASLLPLMPGIDPARLLAAVAMNESTLGENCGPRYEKTWDVGGEWANAEQQKNLALYGEAAAKSYGPWQIMFYNCPGYTPAELDTDLSLVTRATIGYLVRQIQRWKSKGITFDVPLIGEMWNWGHPERPFENGKVPQKVQDYCVFLVKNYQQAAEWLGQGVTT